MHLLKPNKRIKLIGEYHIIAAKLIKFSVNDIASNYGNGFTPKKKTKMQKNFSGSLN